MSHPVFQRVAIVRRQLGWHRLVVATCRIATVALGVAFVLGFIDFLVRYVDPGLKIMSFLALLAALGWALWKFARPLASSRLSMLSVAQRIEQAFPHLQDRLSSSLVFLAQDENDQTAGSATLRRAVVNETVDEIEELPLDSVVNNRLTRQAAMLLASILALVALVTALDPTATRTAATRLLLPWSATEWPHINQLEFRNVPDQIAAGEAFEIELVDVNGKLPEEVVIHYHNGYHNDYHNDAAGRNTLSEPMKRIGDVMVASREQVVNSFEFRATGGDHGSMPWRRVLVVAAPKLEALTITATPPAYTGLPDQPVEDWYTAIEGTEIAVTGDSNEPLQSARVRFASGAVIDADLDADLAGSQVQDFRLPKERWIAQKSDEYWIELENRQGIVGRSQHRHLQVEPDPPPTVIWQQPHGDLFVLPQAIVPIALFVEDNLQIQTITLVVSRSDRSEQSEQRIPLFAGPNQPSRIPDALNQEGETRSEGIALDLESLEIAAGDQLAVVGIATDYRPSKGKTLSPRQITIITVAELQQRIATALENIARRLEQALAWERSVREKVRGLEIVSQTNTGFDNHTVDILLAADMTQRRISDELVDQASGVLANVKSLQQTMEMNRLDDSELRQQLASALSQLNAMATGLLPMVDTHLTTAIKSATNEDDQWQRVAGSLSNARSGQDNIIEVLESMIAEFSQWTGLQRFAQELAHLHARQERLAKATRDLASEQLTQQGKGGNQGRQKQIEQDQADLNRQFGKLQQLMQQAGSTIAEQHPAATERLADSLAKARELGTATKLHDAQQQLRENKLGRAARLQSQIANDLKKIQQSLRGIRQASAEELATQQLDALRSMLATAVDRQQDVVERTREIDESRSEQWQLTAEQSRSVQELSTRERTLAKDVGEFQTALQESQVIRTVLAQVGKRLSQAAALLANQSTDEQVQTLEQQALAGVKRLSESLEPEVPPESQANNAGGQGGNGGKQPSPGSQYLLAELKLLRAMQADLVGRTEMGNESSAEVLATEQGELAKLVQAILSRSNEARTEPSGSGKGLLERFQQWERALPQDDPKR